MTTSDAWATTVINPHQDPQLLETYIPAEVMVYLLCVRLESFMLSCLAFITAW